MDPCFLRLLTLTFITFVFWVLVFCIQYDFSHVKKTGMVSHKVPLLYQEPVNKL